MYYGKIKKFTVEDGIGCRTALFVSGCRNKCKGCFQPETWNFKFGEEFTQETSDYIIETLKNPYTDGITILGGEPFEPENQEEILNLIKRIKKETPDKSIWIYTGFTFERLMDKNERCYTDHTEDILKNIDILVDGPFMAREKNLMLRFKGSKNQRIIDMKETIKQNKIVLSEWNDERRR